MIESDEESFEEVWNRRGPKIAERVKDLIIKTPMGSRDLMILAAFFLVDYRWLVVGDEGDCK